MRTDGPEFDEARQLVDARQREPVHGQAGDEGALLMTLRPSDDIRRSYRVLSMSSSARIAR